MLIDIVPRLNGGFLCLKVQKDCSHEVKAVKQFSRFPSVLFFSGYQKNSL